MGKGPWFEVVGTVKTVWEFYKKGIWLLKGKGVIE